MITPGYWDLAREILQCERCSWRQHRRGYYPKFGGVSLSGPSIFIISQNPGPPSIKAEWNGIWPEARLALSTTNEEYPRWLSLRISKVGFKKLLSEFGFEWDRDIYPTEAIKCPRKGRTTDEELDEGRVACNDYLSREIELLKPRHLITLGDQAYRAVHEALGLIPNDIQVTNWWRDASEGIRIDDMLLYPLFLPVATGGQNRIREFTIALRRAFELIAEQERSRRGSAA